MKAVSLLAAFISITAGSHESGAVALSEQERSMLASGKTVKKPLANNGENGFFGGTGYAVVDAPADAVWTAIEDWDSYAKVYPNTVGVKEISRKGDRSLLRMEQGHRLISASYYVEVRRQRDKNKISFQLVKNRPHDIDEARGYWRLFPQGRSSTLVAYVVAVKVPMGIVNILGADLSKRLGQALLHVPGSLKKWMEGPQGHRYRPLTASK